MPEWDEIRKEYEAGGVTLKELAEKHGVKDTTLRSRKNREKWDETQRNGNATQRKNVATKKREKSSGHEPVIENDELTEKQRLFCLYYIKSFNGTMAAIKAGYAADSAHVEASRQLRKAKVGAEIKRLKGQMRSELFIDAMDVLNKYVKIAFADITDYAVFGKKEVEVMGMYGPVKDEEGNVVTKEINYVDFKESAVVDGSIITEVKQGKDGVSVKLADKMKALDKLAEYFDLFPDKFKREVEREKLKAKQEEVEIKRKEAEQRNKPPEPPNISVYIDALKGQASEVWNNEDDE